MNHERQLVVLETLDQCLELAAQSAGWGRDDLPEDEALGIAVGWWPSFAGAQPDCSTAWDAAAMANWMKRSILR